MYRHMAIFVAVVEFDGFTAAGKRLGLSKSVLSRMVSELEAELGATLMVRTTRCLSLTDEGRTYYEACSRMVAIAEEANTCVTARSSKPRGHLRIGASSSLGSRLVAPALAEVLAAQPGVSLDLILDDRFADLMDEELDLVVRSGDLVDSSLLVRKLASFRYFVCGSPEYLQTHGIPNEPAELRGHEWIGYDQLPTRLSFRRQGRSRSVTIRPRLRTNSGAAVLELLRGGHGLGLAPAWHVFDDLRGGRLQVVLPEYQTRRGSTFALFPRAKSTLPRVRVVVDALVDAFARHDWSVLDPSWVA